MPTQVPTGIFCQPYRLKLMVAASTTFQGVVKAADTTNALRYVHYPDVDLLDPNTDDIREEKLPPRAIINDETELTRRCLALNDFYTPSGTLLLSFQFYIPADVAAEGHENSAAWFMTKTGGIMADLEVLSRTGTPVSGETHLHIASYSRRGGPFQLAIAEGELPDPDKNEYARELWHVEFSVEFF